MSRWTTNFASHAFRVQLSRLAQEVSSINADDPTVLAHADEVGRLKKVATYLDQAISGIDPELLPLNLWDQVQASFSASADQVAGFNLTKNVGHLHNANGQLDAVLVILRPHLFAKGKLGPALQSAAKAYSTALEASSATLRETASTAVAKIKELEGTSEKLLRSVEANVDAINNKHDELLVDSSDAEATFTTLDRHIDEISAFHRRLTNGAEDAPSIREEVAASKELSKSAADAIEKMRQEVASAVKELTSFESRILGAPSADGSRDGGLSAELEGRMKVLVEVEAEQKRRYAALNDQIESLLPGATSAGLASAYKDLRESFAEPIKNANRLFYLSIALLISLSIVLSIEDVGFWHLKLVTMNDWTSIGRSLAHKLPIVAPLVWLAYYASKRRSEFQRLEQEYAHKEALAKSYESYRKQIADLGIRSDELMHGLLDKSVGAIAFNASTSLDGKHGDKIPAQDVIERMIATVFKEAQRRGGVAG